MSEKQDLINYFKSQQVKYVYYIIALSVACIGFLVNLTLNSKISLILIPAGISMVCWLASIFCGLRFMTWVLASTYANIGMLEIIEGKNKTAGNHPEMKQIGVNTITKILEENQKKVTRLGRIQDYSFYIGVIFFVIWRALVMI